MHNYYVLFIILLNVDYIKAELTENSNNSAQIVMEHDNLKSVSFICQFRPYKPFIFYKIQTPRYKSNPMWKLLHKIQYTLTGFHCFL